MTKTPTIPRSGGKKDKPEKKKKPGPGKPLVDLPQTANVDEETFEEDFSDIEDGFPVAAIGAHHAKVIDFEKSESTKGNPQYVWQFRIIAGDSKDIELRFWTSLLPQARWKAAETLVAVGVAAAGSVAKFKRDDVIGKPCILEVIHDTYEGRLQHKIKRVYPPDKNTVEFAKADKDVPF